MKKLLAVTIIAPGAYQFYTSSTGTATPLYEKPYVAVYGRNTCSHTQQMLDDLRKQGLQPQYFQIDQPEIAAMIHDRIRSSGISTRYYQLPAIDVNGKISVRPPATKVVEAFGQQAAARHYPASR